MKHSNSASLASSRLASSLLVVLGTGGLLVLLFWMLGMFRFSLEGIQDVETADFLSEMLQREILYASLSLLVSTGIIWVASFQKKLVKPFLSFGLVAAVGLIFVVLLARSSECEGLGCIGLSLIFNYSLFALVFLVNSMGFIFLLKTSGSARLVRWLSTILILAFSVFGLLFYQYASSAIQETAEQNFSIRISKLSSQFTLFAPSYLPDGVTREVEKVYDFNDTYSQHYFLAEGFLTIEQSKAQGRFEEWEGFLNDAELNADGHIKEITIDGMRAIFSLTFPYYSDGKPIGGGLVFIKDGTEVKIQRYDNNSTLGAVAIREELVNVVKSLKPR